MDKMAKWNKFLKDNPDVKSLYEDEIFDHLKILESALRNDMLDKLGLDEKTIFKATALKDKILDYLANIEKVNIEINENSYGKAS